jgi:PPOX class probable F420-dependent enzyme
MALAIDTSTEFGQRVIDRLKNEQVAWLVTVNAAGKPNPTFVWFLWKDGSAFLLSQPHQGKVKAIRNNPNVALHFNGGPHGDNMVVLNGTATLLDPITVGQLPPEYLEKYKDGMKSLNLTPESMLAEYSQPIRIEFEKLRGH